MPEYKITAPDGRTFKVTAPEGAKEDDVLARVQREYMATRDPYLKGVPPPPDQPGPTTVTGKPKDFARAGKLMVGMEQPKDMEDYATMAAATAPLLMAGGAGAGALAAKAPSLVRAAAPALGEMATAAGLGATQAAGRGGDAASMGWNALLDATVAGLTRGAASAAAGGVKLGPVKLGLKEWGGPARGFEWATKAPEQALKFISGRMGQYEFVNVPALSREALPITEAVEKLSAMTGPKYAVARQELANEFARLDMQSVKPSAGSVFKHLTSKERFEPGALAQLSEGARRALINPLTRAGIESSMLAPAPGSEVPMGAVIGAAMAPSIVRHLPGGKEIAGEGDEGRRRGGY